jgi:hypothetical protein
MAGNQTDNLMLLDLTTGLPRTPETGGTPDTLQLSTDVQLISGANMLVDGNLTVNGTTTTIHSEQVNIRDNHLYLNADYTATVAQSGGIVVNVLPTATADTIAGSFVAGVPATSNPTVQTTGSGTFSAGDIIQIAGANDQSNDGIYEVLSHVGTTLTIRGVGVTGSTVPWVVTDFTADATAGGDVRIVNVNVLQGTSTGIWQTVTTNTTTGLTYSDITQQGVVDLQEAYVQGNTITTSAGEGNVVIAGTELLQITATGGIDLNTVFDADVNTFDVQMTGANGFSIDGTAASNVSVTSGNLTLSTITSGDIIASSAGLLDVDAATSMTFNTSDAADASTHDITFTAGSSTAGNAEGGGFAVSTGDGFGTGNGGDLSLTTGGSGAGATGDGGDMLFTAGDSNATAGTGGGFVFTTGDGVTSAGSLEVTGPNDEDEAPLVLTTTGTNGNSVEFYTGTSNPNGLVTASAGSIFLRDTGTGGEVWVNDSTGSGTSWSQLTAGGGNSLQQAYVAGNTIVTDPTNGPLDVSGTEAISLDASQASNFSVAGANLTLETTTSGNLTVSAADVLALSAGDEGAAAGNAVTIDAGDGGGANDGGAVTITSGNSGAGATGNAGGVSITAGNAFSTNGDGGVIALAPGANTGTGTHGFVDIVGSNDEDEFLVRLTTTGTNGDSVQLFVGDSDPNGTITADAGSLFFQDTGTGAVLWLNTSTGSGTTWTNLATGGTVTDLQTAYEGGNTIVTDATNGPLDVSGTQAISLDASAASNFTVDSAALSLGTTTTGNVDVTSAGLLDLDATGALSVNSSGGAINIGDDAVAQPINVGTGAAARTISIGNTTGATAVLVDSGTGGFSIDSAGGASNVTVDSNNLTLSTTTSGNILVDAADNAAGAGGDVTINSGSSLGAGGAGGALALDAGDGNGTGNGGAITIDGGNSGAGATGNGGAVTISAGDAISTNGVGADVSLVSGDGTGTGAGGNVNLTLGSATGTGTQGSIVMSGPNDEGEALVTLTTTGTGGDSVQFFVGDNDPNGTVTGLAGSLFLRDTGTGGVLYVNESTGSGTVWRPVVTSGAGGSLTLQLAYEGGNTIVTDTTNGAFDVSGTEAISLDAAAASNFSVAGANLTLETTTSGSIIATSAGLFDLNAGANLDVDVTGTMDFLSSGAFSIDGTGASNVTATSGNLALSTVTSGNVEVTSADAVNVSAGDEAAAAGNVVTIAAGNGGGANDGGGVTLTAGDSGAGATGDGGDVALVGGDATSTNGNGGNLSLTTGAGTGAGSAGSVLISGPNDEGEALVTLTTTGTGGDSAQFFVGDNDPNGSVTGLAGSLFLRDTGTGGVLYVNESTGSGTVWRPVVTSGAGGSLTLQLAYEGGNTIVTDTTNGAFDVSGTEAISLDAAAASNFSVAGANLTLETTTSGTLDLTSANDIQMTFQANNATGMVIDDGTNNFLTFDSTTGDLAVEVNQFMDVTTGAGGLTLTAAATIAVGDIVTINQDGEVILADSNTGTDEDAFAIGVAATAATATNPVKIYTLSGVLVPVNFAAAPAATANGEVVFVSSTGGEGTITPPVGMGNVLYKVGFLQGADGATTQPLVLLQPQYLARRP